MGSSTSISFSMLEEANYNEWLLKRQSCAKSKLEPLMKDAEKMDELFFDIISVQDNAEGNCKTVNPIITEEKDLSVNNENDKKDAIESQDQDKESDTPNESSLHEQKLGHNEAKSRRRNLISLEDINKYYTSNQNPLFNQLVPNTSVLAQALQFSAKKKHAGVDGQDQIPRSRMKLFLCSVHYFSLLWGIFDCENEKEEEINTESKIEFIVQGINTATDQHDMKDEVYRLISENQLVQLSSLLSCIKGIKMIQLDESVSKFGEDLKELATEETEESCKITFSKFCSYAVGKRNSISLFKANDPTNRILIYSI